MILKVQSTHCPLSPDLGLLRRLEVLDYGLASWSWFGYMTGPWYTHVPNFGSLSWFWRCKEHPCPLRTLSGLWRMLEVPDWDFASWHWFGYGPWFLVHPYSEFWLYLDFKGANNIHVLLVMIGALEDDECSWSEFCILRRIWIWSLVFDTTMIRILALYLVLKVQKTSMSFKSSFVALEDAGGSWLGFCILIWIWIGSMVFGRSMFKILALYFDLEGAKNTPVQLIVLTWSFKLVLLES